jgi:hypothetical protein
MNILTLGIKWELITLLIIQTTSISAFAKFEIETPLLRSIIKWFIIDGIALTLYHFFDHWAMLFILLSLVPGTIYHFMWCKRYGINPLKATPRKRYYELRGWKWQE